MQRTVHTRLDLLPGKPTCLDYWKVGYHMSCVGFYGEDQLEALKRHVVLSHTICRYRISTSEVEV